MEGFKDANLREGLKDRVGGVFSGWVQNRIWNYGNKSLGNIFQQPKPISAQIYQQTNKHHESLEWIKENF